MSNQDHFDGIDPTSPSKSRRGRPRTDLNTVKPTVGHRIKELRRLHGHTQAHLAQRINIANKQILRYEGGKMQVPVDRLHQIACLYNVSLDSFFEDRQPSELEAPSHRLVMRLARSAMHLDLKRLRAVIVLIEAHNPGPTEIDAEGEYHNA
jgi:transcriptional regulator with XRE-family HTH domain